MGQCCLTATEAETDSEAKQEDGANSIVEEISEENGATDTGEEVSKEDRAEGTGEVISEEDGPKSADDAKFEDMPQVRDLKKFVPSVHIAKVVKVYDGDTFTVGAPLHIEFERRFYKFSVRLAAVDCPELRTKDPNEKQVALEAKKFVTDRLLNRVVRLTDSNMDKYGRLLARVSYNGEDLATQLIDAHLAVPYNGGKKMVIDDWVSFRKQAKSSSQPLKQAVENAEDASMFGAMPPLSKLDKFMPPVHIAKVVKVYDGDTITVGVPLQVGMHGDSDFYKFSVRVLGIDCPEMRSKNPREKQVALEAKEFVSERILNRVVHLTDHNSDKYGRLLAHVSYNGQDLSAQLIEAHLAVPYDGGTKTVVDDWIVIRDQVKVT